jgi:hypothetical protein
MLGEAIVNLKAGVSSPAADRWSPSIDQEHCEPVYGFRA